MKKLICAFVSVLVISAVCYGQSDSPTLFQKPAVNHTQIVFVYAGDLWLVPRQGGDAKRLTTGIGIETDPIFSPDGTQITFTGEYDGNTDVYVIPATGGVPKRLTYHPGPDVAVGWTNDGKRVLFNSGRNSYSGFTRLFTIGLDGGFPEEVPLPMAQRGSYSPDSAFLAYEPLVQWQPDWKRYRGGQQGVIWIAKLTDSSIEKLPRERSNDKQPMWIGDKIYFLSDRNGSVTLFSFDTKSKKVEQLIRNDGLDIKWATAGPGVIAYEQFGKVYLYDLKERKSQQVKIRLAADVVSVRPHFEKVGTRIAHAAISPTGARALFEARGEIISVPAEKGDARNLTNTPGVMEREPTWSPDGKWIAYFSDESGEYALHLRDQKGMGEVNKIALPPTFYGSPTWSPDSKKIAFSDKKLQLWHLEVDKGTPVKVDSNLIGLKDGVLDPRWSPDSRWIAYAKQLPNLLRAIFIYSLETAKTQQITDGLSDARHPAFDKSGKYLFFTASTNLGPTISFADLSGIAHQSTRSVYAVVLRGDLPSPLAPESDEEKVEPDKAREQKSGDKPADKGEEKKTEGAQGASAQKKGPEPVRIDFEGIDQRIVALPIPARNFIDLQVGKMIYLVEAPPVSVETFGPPSFIVNKFDLEKRKFDKALEGVSAF